MIVHLGFFLWKKPKTKKKFWIKNQVGVFGGRIIAMISQSIETKQKLFFPSPFHPPINQKNRKIVYLLFFLSVNFICFAHFLFLDLIFDLFSLTLYITYWSINQSTIQPTNQPANHHDSHTKLSFFLYLKMKISINFFFYLVCTLDSTFVQKK